MSTEEWRPVPGISGYEVINRGKGGKKLPSWWKQDAA